jgi:hypothetical protein
MLGPDVTVGEPQKAKVLYEKTAGLGTFVVIVVVLVVLVVFGAIVLGLVNGGDTLEVVKNKTGVNLASDGWSTYDDPAGGFTVEFPDGERKSAKIDDAYTAYTFVSKDTLLDVAAKRIMSAEDAAKPQPASPIKTMETIGDQLENTYKSEGARIDKRTTTNLYGYPAIYFEMHSAKQPVEGLRTNEVPYTKRYVFLKDGVLYTIDATSVFRDLDKIDRLVSSLNIYAPPGTTTGTTAPPPS